MPQLKLYINTIDFINSINSGVLKISDKELKTLKENINIFPEKSGNTFIISDSQFNSELKKVIDTYLIRLELI